MSKWDKVYNQLCRDILKEGIEVENRTGTNTIKLDGYYLEFDLEEEFPALTYKQLFYRNAILEMLWIYQVGSNDVRWLQERGVNIWDSWAILEDGTWRAKQRFVEDGKIVNKETIKLFDPKDAHTIGTAYGYIAKRYQLMQKLIETIRVNPNDRRMVKSLWQDEFIETAVLPSCVWSTEWNVYKDRINFWVHQRSCDVPVGLPFNVTQYAFLGYLIAHLTGYKPGKMRWSINEPHIYIDQIDGINLQLGREKSFLDYPAPQIEIDKSVRELEQFDNSRELKHVKILNYRHHGPIPFNVSK